MLAIADLGKFMFEAICSLTRRLSRYKAEQDDEHQGHKVPTLLLSLLLFILLTTMIIPLVEHLDFVDAVYFRQAEQVFSYSVFSARSHFVTLKWFPSDKNATLKRSFGTYT